MSSNTTPDYTDRQVILRVFDDNNNCIRVCQVSEDDLGSVLNIYGEVTSVAASTLTSVVSYTVPASKVFIVSEVEASGCNVSTFKVLRGVSNIATKRSYWCDFNVNFPFHRLKLSAGETIELKAEHSRTSTGDYEARIVGRLEDA